MSAAMKMTLDQAAAGDCVAEYETGPITRAMLAQYAEASGDLNPLHLDKHFAQKAGFEDVIVHGMLGMALLGRLVTSHFAGHALRSFDARFVAVLAVEQSLKCRAIYTGCKDGAITLALEAADGRGTAIIAGTATLSAKV